MSLRKSPTLTPALLASNRQNAKQSTGPRTAQGKAWSRLNHMRHGAYSPEYINFVEALLDAPPGRHGASPFGLQARASPRVCGDRGDLRVGGNRHLRGEPVEAFAVEMTRNKLFLRSKPECY